VKYQACCNNPIWTDKHNHLLTTIGISLFEFLRQNRTPAILNTRMITCIFWRIYIMVRKYLKDYLNVEHHLLQKHIHSSRPSGNNLFPFDQSSESADPTPVLKAMWSFDLSADLLQIKCLVGVKVIVSSRRSQWRAIRKNNSSQLPVLLAWLLFC